MRTVLLTALLLAWQGALAEPVNLADAKVQLERYVRSGQYASDLKEALGPARHYLLQRLSQPHGKVAIVMDVDETVLSNYKNMRRMGFGGDQHTFDAQDASEKGQALLPVLKFYRAALKQHVHVFFISGRQENVRRHTLHNLWQAGFKHFDRLFLRRDHQHHHVQAYKTQVRCELERQGYDIILNIGDQISDLKGGCSDKTVKLPNPFYRIPG